MRTTISLILGFSLVVGAAPLLADASTPSVARVRAQGGGQPPQAQKKAQKPKPNKPAEKSAAKRPDTQPGSANRPDFDRDGHVRVIREFSGRESLPPGLAKREDLPPGLRRQLRERGTLPPGLQKRLVPVPAEWAARMPSVGRYERRYFGGNDLIVVDTRSNTIVAYLPDVLR